MLTQDMNALVRGIPSAYDARMAAMAKLRKSTRERQAQARRMRAELAKSEAARAAGVKSWMRTVTADRVGAHDAWQALTVTMHGKRVAAAKKPAAPEPAPAAKTE